MHRILAGILWVGIGLGMIQGQVSADLPRGEVIPRIVCQDDTSQSYALFLPSYYSPDKSWPTLFVFDPVARGELALNVFKPAAEEFGFILAGSNNAQNGPMEPIIAAINSMSPDLDRRVKVDAKRLYATGFSGGSRVASLVGMHTGALVGVIGCGAGFPQLNPPTKAMSFDYIGLIGNLDMNYLEMQRLETSLQQTGTRHLFVGFSAGHQWPPEATISTAFTWLSFRAMERGLRDFDPAFLEKYQVWAQDSIAVLEAGSDAFGLYQLYAELSQTLKGVPGAEAAYEAWESKRAEKEALPEVKERLALRSDIAKREQEYLERYTLEYQAIELSPYKGDSTMAGASWWKKEIKGLNALIEEGETEEDQLLGQRMIDYLWRGAFVRWRGSYQGQQYGLAKKFAQTWSYIQPEAPGPMYVLAKTEITDGQSGKGLKTLKKAVELGFSNKAYLEQDIAFEPVRNHKKYRELLAAIPDP